MGRWGEAQVAADMRKRGWVILASGYYCRFGEIDLIAENGTYLSFTEVKLRKDKSHGLAAEAVDARKQRRLRLTAELYLAQNPTQLQPRFDVAEVYAPQGMRRSTPKYTILKTLFRLF